MSFLRFSKTFPLQIFDLFLGFSALIFLLEGLNLILNSPVGQICEATLFFILDNMIMLRHKICGISELLVLLKLLCGATLELFVIFSVSNLLNCLRFLLYILQSLAKAAPIPRPKRTVESLDLSLSIIF